MHVLSKWKQSYKEARSRRDFYREWDRQREKAQGFGASHINEVDAIFSRHEKQFTA
jgi:hypothetical protein